MAGNVLNSPHAINMNVFVVRAFVRLRHTIIAHFPPLSLVPPFYRFNAHSHFPL
jgi:hypothetical protein